MTVNDQKVTLPFIRYNARQAIVKGVAIIISEMQAQGQIDSNLHALAENLPDWGWHTVLITPNQAYLQTIIKHENATENSEPPAIKTESETQTYPQVNMKPYSLQDAILPYTHEHYVSFLTALIDALNVKFAQQPGYKIMYAGGQSAAALVSLMSEGTTLKVDGLVIGNAYWPTIDQNQRLPKQLASLPMPVLDLTSMYDSNWAKLGAHERVIASKVSLKALYRQRELIGAKVGSNQHEYLAKEIVAWTYFLGW
jgi:hypothetical protein